MKVLPRGTSLAAPTDVSTRVTIATRRTPERARPARRVVRITANLPVPVFVALQELAQVRGTTMTEVLRRAISTEQFIQKSMDRGEVIMVASKDRDKAQELIFRP